MLAKRVKELLKECAYINGWMIGELSIQLGHVHMLAQLSPDINVSKVVQLFKDKSNPIMIEGFLGIIKYFMRMQGHFELL